MAGLRKGSINTLADVLAGAPGSVAIAVTQGGPVLRRGQLQACVIQTACALIAAGIKPGDVVSMAFANTVDFIVSFLAVTYARAVAAPLNAAYKTDEFHFYLQDASARLLLLPEEGNKAATEAAQQLNVPRASIRVVVESGAPVAHLTPLTPGLVFGPAGTAPTSGQPSMPDPPRPSDVALFLHTSGTTSRPKGVPLSHGNLAASLANIVATYELTASDVSYLVMPLFHVHGLMAGLLSPLSAGASVVLPAAGKFGAGVFWRDCCEHRVTFYTAVPTIHQVLLARAAQDYPRASPPPLRFIRSCSSSLAPATLEQLEKAFCVPVLEAYAMTEASHQMTSNPLPKHGPRKPGSVGRAQGGVQVAVLDPQNRPLPAGQVGEVCIRGANVTSGYLNNPKANEEAFAGGWFHTGDQGFLDADGYLTLTGRIKELINRGGEKISPLEVDSALLSHPAVAEAVSFGAPDDKYGEVVAAAVVLKPGAGAGKDMRALESDIRSHCGQRLAAFKVPSMIFFTEVLPKTATGKIQRRHMVGHFCKPQAGGGSGAAGATSPGPAAAAQPTAAAKPVPAPKAQAAGHVAGIGDGHALVAASLAHLGVKYMFGVVGIPVTPLASAAQAAGIRYIGFRNEQAAGYAAAAAGYLTGCPAVLLTVSGPGAIHGIAGASHAGVNGWPLLMVSGSADRSEVGKGGFQEADQVAVLEPYTKYAAQAASASAIPSVLATAVRVAKSGRPGACYVDLPSDVLGEAVKDVAAAAAGAVSEAGLEGSVVRFRPRANAVDVAAAAALLRGARKPLIVAGRGAAQAHAEDGVRVLANEFGLPVLCTAGGRGILPDSHQLCVNAARSACMAGADVVLVVGARLNWQLHFGEPPKWAPDAVFVLVDIEPSAPDVAKAKAVLQGDAAVVLEQLLAELRALPGVQPERWSGWVSGLRAKAKEAQAKQAKKLSAPPPTPLDYYSAFSTIRAALQGLPVAPVVVAEGANTMDMARTLVPCEEPRTRLDAGTWGTMGVGLGAAIAAAVIEQSKPEQQQQHESSLPGSVTSNGPRRVVLALQGDSAFGFSGMELETAVRYKLPIVVVVFNNGGVYGGDRRPTALAAAAAAGAKAGGFATDPAPTAFVPDIRYDAMMAAFGGAGVSATSASQLRAVLEAAFLRASSGGGPMLVNAVIDPLAGVESGNVHAFNAPRSKL